MMGQLWRAKVNFKFKCNVFMATVQVALLTGLCTFAGQNGSITGGELNQLEASQKKLARRLVAMTRINWDTEQKKATAFDQGTVSKAGNSANRDEAQRLEWAN